jgi:MYXO-CTERM domain-containing protein
VGDGLTRCGATATIVRWFSLLASRFSLLFGLSAAGLIEGVTGCLVEADSSSGSALLTEARDEPRVAVMGTGEEDCEGDELPSCDVGWTGPSCDHACDPGAPACGFRYYCHSDGRIAGVALSRAHLFAFSPTIGPLAIRDLLEHWVATHEIDLDMPAGLTTETLQLEPADNFEVEQGLLTLYRFRQSYNASSTHPEVPIVGEGALLTLEADGTGAVALAGTLVDPRVPYAHATTQAPASQARDSIKRHASLSTGIPAGDIEVDALQLVAVPWAEQLAWYGIPKVGPISTGRVIVDADPAVVGWLDLLMYDDGKAYALHNTTPITVQTQDPMQDPWAEPMPESSESTLVNGAPLLGSVFDGNAEPQLGTEEVVVLDMHGNEFDENLYDDVSMTWDFERYTEAAGQFSASEPDEQFRAQRLYHLVKSGYAVVNRIAVGKWDSAVSYWYPMLQSAYAPGAYQPRIIVGYNHAPTGAAGQAWWFFSGQQPAVLSGFQESIQQPAPNLQNEPVATLNVPLGLIDADVLFHEVGHDLDVFLAPGYPKNHAPSACPGCTGCQEDTSDEANPLTETIAQMFAMWQLVRVFPDTPHDTCNLMDIFTGGSTSNQKNVHSPGCMDSTDSIGLFIRDDDPTCPDATLCDKPSDPEVDATMGSAHWCDATEGYNTFSILQVWWNSLYGLYCEPPGPMGVTCVSETIIWPPGCDQPGSGIDCATPDEVAGLALVYAVRNNPTSYVQFVDDMAKFVACNYGAQAYASFNQALCDHQIRACDEPLPMDCQQCGNGIREGSEQCDGYDLSIDEIGYTPTCMDFAYEGGTLACQGLAGSQPCFYDFSQCTMPGLDDTGTSTGSSTTDDSSSDSTSSPEDATGPGGADGGGGNCACTTGGSGDGRDTLLALFIVALLTPRRRGRPSTMVRASRAALLVMLGAAACTDDGVSIGTGSSSTASTSSSTDTQAGSTSETGSVPAGWPEKWYGDYYEDPGMVVLGYEHSIPYLNPNGFRNVELEADEVTIVRFSQDVDVEEQQWTLSTELDRDALRILPPGGQWEVLYPGVDDVLFRPGTECDELVLEIHSREPPYEPFYSTRWFRGSLCVIDPYDDSIANDKWMVDLCPESVLDCDE